MSPFMKFVMLLGGGLFSAAAWAQTLGIATTPQGTFNYSASAAVAKVMSEKAGLQVSVEPQTGTTAAFPLMNSKRIEFTTADMIEGTFAITGTGTFNGQPHPNVRVLANFFPIRVGIAVRKNSPIKTVADLKGQRFSTQWVGQPIIGQLINGIFATAGLSLEKDVKPVPVPALLRGADDFAAGKVDGVFFALGAGKMSEVDAAVGGIRWLSIDASPQALERMRRVLPSAFLMPVDPAPNFAGILARTNMLAYYFGMFAGVHVSDDAVYKTARALHESQAALREILPAQFGLFDPNKMALDFPGIQYHPGAIKFYTEKGLWPAAKL